MVIQGPARTLHIGITSVYAQGTDNAEVIETAHARRPPMVPVSKRFGRRGAAESVERSASARAAGCHVVAVGSISGVGRGRFVEESVQDRAKELLELRSVIQRQAVGSLVSHCETLARVEGADRDVGVTIGYAVSSTTVRTPVRTRLIGVASISCCDRAGRSRIR